MLSLGRAWEMAKDLLLPLRDRIIESKTICHLDFLRKFLYSLTIGLLQIRPFPFSLSGRVQFAFLSPLTRGLG